MPTGHLGQGILHLRLVVGEVKLVNLGVHLVGPEVSVGGVSWHHDLLVLLDELVAQLDRQAEIKVEDASLAHILHLGARLADLRLLVPRRLRRILGARLPAENRERPLAGFALPSEFRTRHPYVGIIPEARLAQDGEVGLLPALLVYAGTNA